MSNGQIVQEQEMTSANVQGGDVNIGQELSNVKIGELIRSSAMAIAEAQFRIDQSSLVTTEIMSGQQVVRNTNGQLLNADGVPSTDASEVPVIRDSRIYFGYDKIGDTKIPTKISMLELGFSPTFYQFVDTIIELKIAVNFKREASVDIDKGGVATQEGPTTIGPTTSGERSYSYGSWWWGGSGTVKSTTRRTRTVATTTPVNSRYSSKFSYNAMGSSFVRTKLSPIPAPAILEERVRALMNQRREEIESMVDNENAAVEETVNTDT